MISASLTTRTRVGLSTLLLVVTVGVGTLLSGCEKGPTDYAPENSVSTTQLSSVLLKNARQTIAVNGVIVEDFNLTPTNLLDVDSLFSLRGHIDRIGERTLLSLDLDVRFPETGIFALVGFSEPQPRGFTIELDSLELQTEWTNRHSTLNCPQSAASLKIARLHTDTANCENINSWVSPQIIPATAELSLDLEEDPEVDDRISGGIAITGTYRSPNGSIVFYNLYGEIELE